MPIYFKCMICGYLLAQTGFLHENKIILRTVLHFPGRDFITNKPMSIKEVKELFRNRCPNCKRELSDEPILSVS